MRFSRKRKTVFENVSLALEVTGERGTFIRKKTHQTLRLVDLAHKETAYPLQLSGGEQQRVAIARAFITRPGILFADEPTGNLDSKNGIEVMNLLSELNQEGATIIMVTHSDRDAGYAHRIINLFDGQVIMEKAN